MRMTIKDGRPVMEDLGARSSRDYDETAAPAAASRATVRSPLGDAVTTREVRDTDLVKVGGVEMKVGQAKALGLYRESAQEAPAQAPFVGSQPGGLDNAPAHQEAAAGAAQGSSEDAGGEALGEAVREALGRAQEVVSAGAEAALLADVTGTGEVSERSLQRVAQEAGIDVETARERVTATFDAAHGAISERMVSRGVADLEAFDQWVASDPGRASGLRQATREFVRSRSVEGFDRLAQGFTAELDRIAPEAVTRALTRSGINHGKASNGRLWVEVPGHGRLGFPQAVKLGLVRVSA
jgi:hypothetical protein